MTFDLPAAEDLLPRDALRRNAALWPDETFITFEDGETWTRLDGLAHACGAAEVLHAAGVEQGDRVAVFLGNGSEFVRAWLGTAMLGATLMPINTGYQGTILARLFQLGRPKALVATPERLQALRATDVPEIHAATAVLAAELRQRSEALPVLERRVELHDPAVLLMTSGTTGPSKLVINTGLHAYLGGSWFVADSGRGREDTLLIDLPLFHGAALWWSTCALANGTRIVVRSMPAMRNYWEVARDNGITMGMLLSTMVPFLLQQDIRPAEREHMIRIMVTTPPPKDLPAFMARFRLPEIRTGYGLTEVPSPIVAYPGDEIIGSYCGRQREGFDCRLVDGFDLEAPVDEPGELIVRAAHPWMITPGYVDDAEATAAAWRNGWFHTGDMMRRDKEGRYFFVDRAKDAMRRRGENISSTEVEGELRLFPGVAEAACVPFRDEKSLEDEVKVWIVPRDGANIDFPSLLRFAVERMPYFMIPRYFELTDALPLTNSMRVKKFELRQRGNGPNTWDREAHGFRVTRRGLDEPQTQSAG